MKETRGLESERHEDGCVEWMGERMYLFKQMMACN